MEVPPISKSREVARSIGEGFRTVGRGVYETGAGFIEGAGLSIPSPKTVGKAAGKVARGAYESIGSIELRDPNEPWEGWDTPQKTRKPSSRLPLETQLAIIVTLGELYPELYMSIWYPGIKPSEFTATLRDHFPDTYEEMREYTYSTDITL